MKVDAGVGPEGFGPLDVDRDDLEGNVVGYEDDRDHEYHCLSVRRGEEDHEQGHELDEPLDQRVRSRRRGRPEIVRDGERD